MRIEYVSHINSTGYGKAAKAYIIKLDQMGHMVSVRPIGQPQFFDTPEDNKIKTLIDRNIAKPDVRIIHAVPHSHICMLALQNDGVYTIWFYAWELSVLPPMFIDIFNKVEHCVTFADWQVDAYKKNTGKDNISYLPHVINEKPEYKKTSWNSPFTFFSMLRWDERKDPNTLIKAFIYAFDGHMDSVRLLLKVSDVKQEQVNQGINNLIRLARLTHQSASIQVVAGNITEKELDGLYQQADVFISTTRGEGWGFGFNEALERGIPVIYPNSPYLVKSFFNEKNSIGVPIHNALVYNSAFPQITPNMLWGQVDEVAVVNTMRTVYNNHNKMFNLPVVIGEKYEEEQKNIETYINAILDKVP